MPPRGCWLQTRVCASGQRLKVSALRTSLSYRTSRANLSPLVVNLRRWQMVSRVPSSGSSRRSSTNAAAGICRPWRRSNPGTGRSQRRASASRGRGCTQAGRSGQTHTSSAWSRRGQCAKRCAALTRVCAALLPSLTPCVASSAQGLYPFGDLKGYDTGFPKKQLEAYCGPGPGDWAVMSSHLDDGSLVYGIAHRRGTAVHTFLSTHGTTKRGYDQAHKESSDGTGHAGPPRRCTISPT
jgi:hypothetical protein